jgi:hypothetical protein
MLLDVDYVLFQKLYTVFFYKLNIDCVFYPTVTDELMLVSPSLLWTLVVLGR